MKDLKHIKRFNESDENLNSELSKDTSSSISDVSRSFTKEDIDSLSREEYRIAQQIAIDFAKWINMENIDMISKDTWHHPYEDVDREINSKELFELFLENYY